MKRYWVLGLILPAAVALAGAVSGDGDKPDDRSDYSRRFEKVLDADPRAVFSLDNSFGDVTVKTWDQAKVSITADIRVDARNEKKAAEYGEKIQIEVTPSAERISVKTVYPTRTGSGSRLSFSVDYTIVVPVRQAADLRNAFGDIGVTGVQGALTVSGKHGGVDVLQCSSLMRLENEFGSIGFQDVGGKAIEVENTNGDIKGSDIRGGLKVRNRFGEVDLVKVQGDLAVRSANGDVRVEGCSGAAEIEDQFGSIRVSDCGGFVKIKSGNGSVDVKNVGGGEIVNSFGEVVVFNTTRADLGLKVADANGDVTVKSVKGNANLSASFGRIDATDIGGDITASAQNSSVEINNPGGKVDVEDTFGPVTVRDARSDVSIRNQNGSIECIAARAGGIINLKSTFGAVKLVLPGDASVSLRAETTFGSIDCDFPMKVAESNNTTTVEGTLGAGGSKISVSNQNGDVQIRKGNSGK
jgi:hypothetical protein